MHLLLAIFMCLISFHSFATKDVHPGLLRVEAGEKMLFFSGYIDGHYAYDFSDPYNGSNDLEQNGLGFGGRDYTSNPLYDKQFSIGYGFFQVEFDHKNVGFRLAYHFGDIVQKMYIDEPERLKDIREASVNVRFTDKLLLEVGYMPSIFGFETFINKENMHATRAYMTDFAPDFDAGARLYYKNSQHEVLKVQVTNGWQVERDKNNQPALGLAYVKEIPKVYLFNWGMFIGDESLRHKRTSYRWYNNIFAKLFLGDRWIVAPMLDLGWEQQVKVGSNKKPWAPWQSYGLSVRYALNDQHGVAGRYDRTRDPSTIVPELNTGSVHGWNSNGYTLTYEYLYSPTLTFRLEGRYVKSQDAIFQTDDKDEFSDEDSFVLTQIALSF
jgi:hypothetical protein